MVDTNQLLLLLPLLIGISGLLLFLLSFLVVQSFLSFTINDFNLFNALFIFSGSFNEYILLCKSWNNFAAIAIRISGIPSSASLPLLILSDSASINKLNFNKNYRISLISNSRCLLLIFTEINLCSNFIFFR